MDDCNAVYDGFFAFGIGGDDVVDSRSHSLSIPDDLPIST